MPTLEEYAKKIAWGEYTQYEGPWTRGEHSFVLPAAPLFLDKVLAVLTATEGGRYGAVNMYDRCIASVGLIQWCEAAPIFSITKMLTVCAQHNPWLLRQQIQKIDGLDFSIDGQKGFLSWRGTHVTTKELQRQVFLGGSSGLKKQWTDEQKASARHVCAVLAQLWDEPVFRQAQLEFTRPKLLDFATHASKKVLFPDGFPTYGWAGALRAGYLSYAGNLPEVAAKHFDIAYAKYGQEKPEVFCVELFKQLTFGPAIAIYPIRYDAIRKQLEKLFEVDLPDLAEDLKKFHAANPLHEEFSTVKAIQEALITLGYDLGPKGADDVMGSKTRSAIRELEQKNGLVPDGVPDSEFLVALSRAVKAVKVSPLAVEPEPVKAASPAEETPMVAAVPAEPVIEKVPLSEAPTVADAPATEPAESSGASKAAVAGVVGSGVLIVFGLVGRFFGWF